ncbi:hypothetical protein OG21DRAFT_1499994 [Imleria badia]|nr:hypothetical protein OG21DRAFT_1499994 [Imleria badia]
MLATTACRVFSACRGTTLKVCFLKLRAACIHGELNDGRSTALDTMPINNWRKIGLALASYGCCVEPLLADHRRSLLVWHSITMSYPPVAFPPPLPLVRFPKKLSKVLGDVPRVPDDDIPRETQTHPPPPLLKFTPSSSSFDAPDSPMSTYHRRGSVLSVASPIISNAASGSSTSDAPTSSVCAANSGLIPATAIFPITPSPHAPHGQDLHFHGQALAQPDDTCSLAFSIRREHTHGRSKHLYQMGPLPPVSPVRPIPAHLAPSPRARCEDDTAGSKIGWADFKAAMRAKPEGRIANRGRWSRWW